MKRFTLLFLCLAATGCATAPRPAASPVAEQARYSEAAASALAFDPPIAAGAVHPEFARGPRAPGAFFGYTQSTTEVYTSATDDLQTNLWGDVFTHESLSVKSTVNTR